MSLKESLSDASRRGPVIDDCVLLVDGEVQKKKGMSGVVVKAGYKAVKGIKPGFIRQVVNKLFDEWVEKLDPFWQKAVDGGSSPPEHLVAERSRVAEALLSVTDAKAENASSALIRRTYLKLRPAASKHVEEAVPALAELLGKHAG